MSLELAQRNAVFRSSIDACDRVLQDRLPELHRPRWLIIDELLKPQDTRDSQLGRAEVASPVTTALQIALVDLLCACGISFAAVVGHSSGELAAAYAAGLMSLEDCMKIAFYKGFAAQHVTREGAMMAVGISYDAGLAFCAQPRFRGRIEVAASNAPMTTTLAGDADAVAEAQEILSREGTFVRLLRVDRAHHTNHTSESIPFLREYLQSAVSGGHRSMPVTETGTVWISSAYGDDRMMDDARLLDDLNCEYWLTAARQVVLFSQAIECAITHGPFDLAIEIGPHPALKGPTTQTVTAALNSCFPYVGVLQRGKNAVETSSACLGSVWESVRSNPVRLDNYHRTFYDQGLQSKRSKLVKGLPSYQWDQRRHWHESRPAAGLRLRDGAHPNELLGRRCPDDSNNVMRWRNVLTLEEVPWLGGHAFQGTCIFPMAGYICMALEASLEMAQATAKHDGASLAADISQITVTDLMIHKAMSLEYSGEAETVVTLSLESVDSANGLIEASFICEASTSDNTHSGIIKHCTARVCILVGQGQDPDVFEPKPFEDVLDAGCNLDADKFYAHLDRLGLQYGEAFRAIRSGSRREGSRTATTSATWSNRHGEIDGFNVIHPALLDVAFQTIIASLYPPASMRFQSPVLPVSMDRIAIDVRRLAGIADRSGPVSATSKARYEGTKSDPLASVSIRLLPEHYSQGQVSALVVARGIRFRVLGYEGQGSNDVGMFYTTAWEPDILSQTLRLEPDKQDCAARYEKIDALERLAFFHIHQFVMSTSPEEQSEFPQWHHRHMTDVYRRLVQDVAAGRRQPYLPPELVSRPGNATELLERCKGVVEAPLVQTVGENLRRVCAGEQDILSVMLQEEGVLESVYDRGVVLRDANCAVAELARLMAHRHPRMNILEVGAGTGGTTSWVLRALGDMFASYTFTDITPGFFNASEKKLAPIIRNSQVSFQVLDVEGDPLSQGYAGGAYDLIIASNCFHATRSLSGTLANMRKLLRPGGFLLFIDITGKPIWLSYGIIFGGLDQWWAGVKTDGRVADPGASHERWHSELVKCQFSGLDQAIPIPERRAMFSVMMSQAVDNTVLALRQPLSTVQDIRDTLKSLVTDQILIIVGSSSTATDVFSLLRETYPQALVVLMPGLEDPSIGIRALPSAGATVSTLLLSELDEPLFSHPAVNRLSSYKALLNASRNFMVVTRDCKDHNPYSNMLLGVTRALVIEMPQTQFQQLDITGQHAPDPSELARNLSSQFLRLLFLSATRDSETKDSAGSLLWPLETELSMRDDCLMLPRIIKDKELNDRLSTGRCLLRRDALRSSDLLKLVEDQHVDDSREPRNQYSMSWDMAMPEGPKQQATATIKTTFCTARDLLGPGKQKYHTFIGTTKSASPGFEGKVAAITATSPRSAVNVHREDFVDIGDLATAEPDNCLDYFILLAIWSGMLLRHLASLVPDGSTVLLIGLDTTIRSVLPVLALPLNTRNKILLDDPGRPGVIDAALCGPRLSGKAITGPSLLRHRVAVIVNMASANRVSRFKNESDFFRDLSSLVPCYHYPATPAPSDRQSMRSMFRESCASLRDTTLSALSRTVRVQALSASSLRDEPAGTLCTATAIDWRGDLSVINVPLDPESIFDSGKTYVFVGLSSDLGLSLCHWAVANGARHLALISRHAPAAVAAQSSVIVAMRSAGAVIEAFSCDATCRSSLAAVTRDISVRMPPIAGVAHGAMVLKDALFSDMTVEDFASAVGPKADVAQNLDEIFRDTHLDFFVLMGSVASVIGNMSQANYHAGNMFMAALARQRRARGFAASVLHLSAVAGVGYVHRVPERAREMTNTFVMLHEEDLHLAFAEAIEAGRVGSHHDCEVICSLKRVGASDKKNGKDVPVGKTVESAMRWLDCPRFSAILNDEEEDWGLKAGRGSIDAAGTGARRGQHLDVVDIKSALRGASDERQAAEMIQASFIKKLENALRIVPGGIDPDTAMSAVGLDSVLAVEMRFWLLKNTRVEIPVLKIMEQSAAQISRHAASEYASLARGKGENMNSP